MEETIMEERSEFMVSPKHTKPINPTRKLAPFLKPSATSVDDAKPFALYPSSVPKSCSLRVFFNGFSTPQKGWKDWVNSMHVLHKSTWQKAGICDAILNSSYEIIKNDDLIIGFAKNWCSETKTFVFGWGEVTITLQDMMILGGFSVLGHSAVNLADIEPDESKAIWKLEEVRVALQRSRSNKACQFAWMKKFKDSGSEIEHEAFLVLWLSRFVFPSASTTVIKSLFSIAVCLGKGVRLALAPAVLASIYKDLSCLKYNMENDDVTKVWAPFQLVQVWIWERFSKIIPNYGDSNCPRFARWDKKKLRVEYVDCGFTEFCWQPYSEDSNDESGRWVVVGDCLNERLESWVRCIRVSELVGIDRKCIKQYLPHRVAMQFGLNQDIPGDVARVKGSRELAWRFYTRPVKDVKVYIPSRVSEPYVTTRYLEWRNKSTGDCSLQSPFTDAENEIFGKNESRSEGSKDSIEGDDVDAMGSEHAVGDDDVDGLGLEHEAGDDDVDALDLELQAGDDDVDTLGLELEAGDDVDTLGLKLEARISKLEDLFSYLKDKKNGDMSI